jgi:hypothetical protein
MPTSNYGSLEGQEESKSFDEKDAYYLKESTLSPEERRRKCMRMALPIITAVLMIGGFAMFLLRDFGILYPGRSGGKNKIPSDPLYPIDNTRIDDTLDKHSNSKPILDEGKKSGMATSCFAHEQCAGLVGECCPTPDGVFLQCCS